MNDIIAIVLLCMLLGCQMTVQYKLDGQSHVLVINSTGDEADHE